MLSAGRTKVGPSFTLCLVCDPQATANPPEVYRELIKGDQTYLNEIEGSQTSIGKQIFVKESDIMNTE